MLGQEWVGLLCILLLSFGFCTACRNYLVKNKSKIVVNKYLQGTNTIPCLSQYYRQA